MRPDGLVVEPMVGAFGAALRGSKAWRHATHPAASFRPYWVPDDDE